MGVFAAYNNNLLAQMKEDTEQDIIDRQQAWQEDNVATGDSEDTTEDSNHEKIEFENFYDIYDAWDNILSSAKSIEMLGTGNVDGHCSGSISGIPASADIAIQNNITQKKDKYGNTYLSFHYIGDEILGFSTTFNNQYYYNKSSNTYTIKEWEYEGRPVSVSEYLATYGYEAPGMLYIIEGNVLSATDLVKTSTGYKCTTTLSPKAAKNYLNFVSKMSMVELNIDYKSLKIDWEFFSDGTLKQYSVQENYVISIDYGIAKGSVNCNSSYVINVGNINRNVYIPNI